MSQGRVSARFSALLFAVAVLGVAGCDFLKGSGGGVRTSPVVSDLRISPASVLCDKPFVVSFEYDDLQDDVTRLIVTFQPDSPEGTPREELVNWVQADGVLDLSVGGLAKYTSRFGCGEPGGRWEVKVQVEDGKGHTSDTVTGTITLVAAG
jgi:hypothetical protein